MQLFQSHTISLYFIAQGEVCPGAGIAALQQRIPGPSLSHLLPKPGTSPEVITHFTVTKPNVN